MTALDMLIVSVPVLDLQYPPSSPAVIKSCVQSAGYRARTLDLNLELLNLCGGRDEFFRVQYNFENVAPDTPNHQDPVLAFFDNDHALIRDWVDRSIDLIVANNPRWLGISVFTYKSHKATLLLCAEIRRRNLPLRIVLGGRGASSFALGPDNREFTKKIIAAFGRYPSVNFGETLLHYGLIDKLIQGDGEQAVIDLLTRETQNNITTSVENIDLESVPFVDFDDYKLDAYDYINEPIIPITGSKGCVRQCTFCDIPVLWPKFRFRSGTHIAKEMIHLYQRHGVRKFYMTDSLVNGSLAAFRDFTSVLADHNLANPGKEIRWVGQYITRPRSKALDDAYYDRIKQSGGEGLTIGVESGSDAVRAHMRKQFSTADIDHELNEFDRRSIVCVLLFFSCYPTETWSDFIDTVEMFIRYQKYCASGTVYKITLGTPYTHHAQTPLWNMQHDIGLSHATGSDILWRLSSNPDLTYYERIRRRLILQEVATALTLPMSRNTAELNQLRDSLLHHRNAIDEYFGPAQNIKLHADAYSLTTHEKILMPPEIQQRIQQHLKHNHDQAARITNLHQGLHDDVLFDNDNYVSLRNLLIEYTQ